MAEMAASILAAAPPSFALAGISMGGYISFEIMRQAPERVIRLALLGTTARPDTPEQTMQRRSMLALARTGDFKALLLQAFGALMHLSCKDDPMLRDITMRMGLAVGVDGMARQLDAIIGRIDSRPTLSAINVPTLVLVGDSDLLTPRDCAEEMVAAIAGSRLAVVPDCGHCSTLEQPEAVSRALIQWIAG